MGDLLSLLKKVNKPEQKRQKHDGWQILVNEGLALLAQRFAGSAAHFRELLGGLIPKHESVHREFCAKDRAILLVPDATEQL